MTPRQKASDGQLLSTRQDQLRSFPTTSTMTYTKTLLHTLCSLLLLFVCADALKFDLQAHQYKNHKSERCIRNFVSKNTLVVVTATLSGYKGDGMIVNMHVRVLERLLLYMYADCRSTDQGRCWQRVRQAERCCGREENSIYFACRFSIRCLLREPFDRFVCRNKLGSLELWLTSNCRKTHLGPNPPCRARYRYWR
jgi:hypothetical protein